MNLSDILVIAKEGYHFYRKEWIDKNSDIEYLYVYAYDKTFGDKSLIIKAAYKAFYHPGSHENYQILLEDAIANDWMYDLHKGYYRNEEGQIVLNDVELENTTKVIYGFSVAMDKLERGLKVSRIRWECSTKKYIQIQRDRIYMFITDKAGNLLYHEQWRPTHDELLAKDWFEYISPITDEK
jgi:hypothetical protein